MIKINYLSQTDEDRKFESVFKLFIDLFTYMESNGLMVKLAEDGAAQWGRFIKRTLNKTGKLLIAADNERIIGFAYGTIRITPEYLGGKKIGYIQYVFVEEGYRRENVGQKLVDELEAWFVEKQVDILELEVLTQSQAAMKFWDKNGYENEFLRMTKKA